METALYLQETPQISEVLHSVRTELTGAIREAMVRGAYGQDINLSFGMIHINSKGSVSQISFNGADVTDMDAFIVMRALRIGEDNYFDIRKTIKDSPEDFCFYPIQINGRLSMTVLKSSPFFEKKYGAGIHWENVRVEYASKYLIVYRENWGKPDVYFVGLFSPEATAKTLLDKAGKALGGKAYIYYCFMNSRPELFLHIGQVKDDFVAYHPEKNPDLYNFYYGTVISGIFKINKETDDNNKIKVRETIRKSLKVIIDIQYGSMDNFCDACEINKTLMTAYLSGLPTTIQYTNGNTLTPTRLAEILNLPFSPDAEKLKEKNLLVKVDYEDIPSRSVCGA